MLGTINRNVPGHRKGANNTGRLSSKALGRQTSESWKEKAKGSGMDLLDGKKINSKPTSIAYRRAVYILVLLDSQMIMDMMN